MKQADIYRLADMIEEIKSLDEMIKLHSAANQNSIMLKQYQAKKIQLVAGLVDELASDKSTTGRSLLLIKAVLEKFFPDLESPNADQSNSDRSSGFQLLEHALAS